MTKELHKPNRPDQSQSQQPQAASTSTQTPTSEQKANALSTSVAHGLRASVNSQVSHLQGLQDAYRDAVSPVVDEASDFFAGAISGEIMWQGIAADTQRKLESLPKPERVDLTPPKLRSFSFQHSEATHNRFLQSSPTAFLSGSDPA